MSGIGHDYYGGEAVWSGKVLLDTPTATPNKGGIFKTNKNSCSREYTAARLREF